MSNNETKDYSLSELEAWIWDALENGCTPEQIHSSIKSTLLKSIKFHKSCYEGGKELFDLLSDRPYFEIVTGYESGYPYSINEKHHSISFNPEDFKLDSPALHTDIDVVFQFDKFKNWLDSKGKSYKDYRAAFRNWLTSAWCEKTNHTINKKLHFKMPDGRNYLGYCSKCLKSDFYEPFNFNPDVVESKCCNSAILNERPVSA